MTLLEIVQQYCIRTGLNSPSAIMNTTDLNLKQMVGLLNEVVQELTTVRKDWTVQQRQKVHTSIAALDQGDLRTLCPGYISMIQGSLYDRTSHLPIVGPLSPAQWEAAMSVPWTSAYSNFRIWDNHLYMYPELPAGYRDWETDRKSTRLNSSHSGESRMPSSA